jgi:hypothetical protein
MGLGLWCLAPLSTIFQLYRRVQIYWWRKPEYPEIYTKNTIRLLYLIFLLGGGRAGGKDVCGRLMSPAHETQSMREIRLLHGKLFVAHA